MTYLRLSVTDRCDLRCVYCMAEHMRFLPKAEVLWASVREVFNIFQADEARVHIVTVPHDILHKAISMCGRDLTGLSLDTVQMFDRDAKAAGFTLATGPQVLAEAVAAAMQKAA